MKTSAFRINNHGIGMQAALETTEKIGAECGLDKKEILRLRLLAEEMFGTLESIAGDVQATYWAECEGKAFSLHLSADIVMDREIRRQLLALSSSGTNAAAVSFLGKLRDLIACILLPEHTPVSSEMLEILSMGSPAGYENGSYEWTMSQYVSAIEGIRMQDQKAADAWDELEKSIVANIADDVSISIVSSHVEITIQKRF